MAVRYYAEFEQYNTRPEIRSEDVIRMEIEDADYVGSPQLLELGGAPIGINFTNSGDNKLEPFRGSGLAMQFLATEDFQLEDLYTDQEMKFITSIYRNGAIKWKGFLIPDGCSERFIDPPYVVNTRCVDGLTILNNIPYKRPDGALYLGKQSILQILVNCLSKLNLGMNINTYVGLEYNGMVSGSDPLPQTLIWNDRFITDEESNKVMTCGEVVQALMSEWNCMIVQRDGEWMVVRIADISRALGVMNLFKYSESGVFISRSEVDINVSLGNNNGDVIHCDNDQLRSIDRPYKQVNVRYGYGVLTDLLDEATRSFRGVTEETFTGWDRLNGVISYSRSPLSGRNYAMLDAQPSAPITTTSPRIALKNAITVAPETNMVLKFEYATALNGSGARVGIKLTSSGNPDMWWNDATNQFQTGVTYGGYGGPFREIVQKEIDFLIPSSGGDIMIYFYPNNNVNTGNPQYYHHLYSVSLTATPEGKQIIAENHITTNDAVYTTYPDPFEVHTGESNFDQYLGTMFKSDDTNQTNGFRRWGETTYVPFLEIASEEILFMYGRPMRKYEGSIYGYFDYFSIFTIENLSGKFMPVSLDYDLRTNKTRAVLIEIDHTPVANTKRIEYEYQNPEQGTIEA